MNKQETIKKIMAVLDSKSIEWGKGDETDKAIAEAFYKNGFCEKNECALEILRAVEQIILDNTYPHFDKDGKPCCIWKARSGYDALDALKKKYKGELQK